MKRTVVSKRWTLFLLGTVLSVASYAAEPLRIAVAGVTHDHLWGVVSQLDEGDIEIVGVWEADARYICDNALSGRVPQDLFFPDLETMLERTRPEAVVAYGSVKDHLTVVRACAPRGIPVMVEKPLATTVQEAAEMAALARRYGILLLTNYETTWYASNHYVKQLTDEGSLGPVYRIEVYDGHEGPVEINCSKKFTDWLTDPVQNGGGAVMDFGCYGANLATWLLNGRRPERVYAVLQHNKPRVYPKVDDDATLVLTYPGTTVQVNASWCWPYGRKDMYVNVKDGYVYQGDASHIARRPNTPLVEVPGLEAPRDNPFRYLAAAVRGEIAVQPMEPSSLENNLIVMEILSAAVESARTGQAVILSTEP